MLYRNGVAVSSGQSLAPGETALTLGCWILIYGAVIWHPWPIIKKKPPNSKCCRNILWLCFLLFWFQAVSSNFKISKAAEFHLKWLLSRTNMTHFLFWVRMESHRKRFETSDVQHTKSICGFYEFLSFIKGFCPKRRKVGFQLLTLGFFPSVQYDIFSHS